jgi:hypothetical protein
MRWRAPFRARAWLPSFSKEDPVALLADPERAAVTAAFQREAQNVNGTGGTVSKADLRAAINAVDQWCEDNAAAFNLAIPLPARSALTSRQKAAILVWVTRRRWELT